MCDKVEPIAPQANTVSLRLPEFCTSNPHLWFLQLKLYFRSKRITADASRFEHLCMLLPEKVGMGVMDIIAQPPETDSYQTLKDAIISCTTASGDACLQSLLSGCQIDNRAPSPFLRHMRTLAGPYQVDEAVLRNLWSQRLPYNTRLILSTQDDGTPLDKLARTADKVHECFFHNDLYAVSSPSSTNPTVQTQLSALTRQLADQTARVDSSRCRPRSRPSSHARSPNPAKRTSGFFFYHQHFGDKAPNCTPPVPIPTCSVPLHRETPRPACDGDDCAWPLKLSPLHHLRSIQWPTFFDRHRGRDQCHSFWYSNTLSHDCCFHTPSGEFHPDQNIWAETHQPRSWSPLAVPLGFHHR